ncbi:MAG: hypothetical protein RJA07_192 [Bacteroidota bacterium]|jgi:hypothetical protein
MKKNSIQTIVLLVAVSCFLSTSLFAQKHSIMGGFGKEAKQSVINIKYIKKTNKQEWGFGVAYLWGNEGATSDTASWVINNNRYVSGGANLFLHGQNLIFANSLIQEYTRKFSSVALQINHNFFFNKNKDAHFEESLKGFYIGNTLSILRTHDRYDMNLIAQDVAKPISSQVFYKRNFMAISLSADVGYRQYFGNNIFLQAQVSALYYAGHIYRYSKEYPLRGFQLAAQLSIGYTFINY